MKKHLRKLWLIPLFLVFMIVIPLGFLVNWLEELAWWLVDQYDPMEEDNGK